MNAELVAAVAAKAAGDEVDVAAVCRAGGISRTTFYRYLRRFTEQGVAGMFPRSRAPHASPGAVAEQVADLIVQGRKELGDYGADAGALSIVDWLGDHRAAHPEVWAQLAPVSPARPAGWVPSRATVHRVLVRRGMVIPAPAKRPRRSYRRFTRAAPNELWQMDGFEVHLGALDPGAGLDGGWTAVVIQIIDDHSRLDLGCYVAPSENGADAWAAFTAAAAAYGLPQEVLTDNGAAFSGARRGWTSTLDAGLRALGVRPITSRPGHPQTCGKDERVHATVQQWLRARPPAPSMTALQAMLDEYREYYNHRRRHSSIGRLTPAQAWALTPRVGPAGTPLPAPLRVSEHPVSASGCISGRTYEIGIGRAFAGRTATVFATGDDATIFIGDQLVRTLTIDRRRRYQPRPKGQ